MRAGIPYRVVGGARFYDRREVKDALAYLRALVNPDDEVSWQRIVNVPQARRRRHVGRQGRARTRRRTGSRSATRSRGAAAAGVSGKALGGIRDLLDIMAEVEGAAERGVAPVVEAVLEDTGYLAELEAERSIEAAGPDREPAGARRRVPRVRRGARGGRRAPASPASPGSGSARRRRPTEIPVGLARVQAFLEAVSLVTDLDDVDRTRSAPSR